MEPLDNFQIEGYEKEEDGETVNKTFAVASLVRKIRIPGSAKPVAYDFFARKPMIKSRVKIYEGARNIRAGCGH